MADIELRLNPARDIKAIEALRLGRQTSNGLLTNPNTGFSSRNRRDVINRAIAGDPCLSPAIVRRRIRRGWTLADALGTSICVGSGSVAFPSFGLTNYWALEEISGSPRLNSIGSVSLNEVGAVTSAPGIRGVAANGNNVSNFLQTPTPVTISQPVTFAMWMKMFAIPASNKFPFSTSDVSITYNNAGNLLFIGSSTYITLALGATSAWHLVVLTIDASLVWKASIDGAAFTQAAGSAAGSGTVTILGGTVNGLMDELGIWNRVLTQQEVTNLWNGGTGRFL